MDQQTMTELVIWLKEKGITSDEIAQLSWRNVREYEPKPYLVFYRVTLGVKHKKVVPLCYTPWEQWFKKADIYGHFILYKQRPNRMSHNVVKRTGLLFSAGEIDDIVENYYAKAGGKSLAFLPEVRYNKSIESVS